MDADAKNRSEEAFRNVYTQLEQLRSVSYLINPKTLADRQRTANEQQRLVLRLRQMPP